MGESQLFRCSPWRGFTMAGADDAQRLCVAGRAGGMEFAGSLWGSATQAATGTAAQSGASNLSGADCFWDFLAVWRILKISKPDFLELEGKKGNEAEGFSF